MTTKRLALAAWLATAVLGSTGCGNLWNDLFGGDSVRGAATPTGDSCQRDPYEALVNRSGQACSLTNPCPNGSFCNAESVCDWDCYRDSQCPLGKLCNCAGQCVGEAASSDAGPATNLECQKDQVLLDQIKPVDGGAGGPDSGVRQCDIDERCPAGSYCDRTSGLCNWDCSPSTPCSGSLVCDCYGRCVPPADGGIDGGSCESTKAAQIELRPGRLTVPGTPGAAPAWTSRALKVALSAKDGAALLATATTLKSDAGAFASAGEGLLVCCAGKTVCSDTNSTSYSQRCALPTSGWTITATALDAGAADGGVYSDVAAEYEIWVRPTKAAQNWTINVYAPRAANSPAVASIAYDTVTEPVGTWTTVGASGLPGVSQGLRGLANITTDRMGALPPFPMDAYVDEEKVVLIDKSKNISETGTLTLYFDPAQRSYQPHAWFKDTRTAGTGLPAGVSDFTAHWNSTTKSLSLSATLEFMVADFHNFNTGNSLKISATLRPAADVYAPTPESLVVSLAASAQLSGWGAAVMQMLAPLAAPPRVLFDNNIYNKTNGVTAANPMAQRPMIVPPASYPFCQDFLGAFSSPWMVHSYDTLLDNVRFSRSDWASITCASLGATSDYELFYGGGLLCMDSKPPASMYSWAFAADASEYTPNRLDCRALYDNLKARGAITFATYEDWRNDASGCRDTNHTLNAEYLYDDNVPRWLPFSTDPQWLIKIYRCPWKGIISKKTAWDDADVPFCYNPYESDQFGPVFSGGFVADSFLPVSQDQACSSGRQAMFPLLHEGDRAAADGYKRGALEVFKDCVADLNRLPSVYDVGDTSSSARAALSQALGNPGCFSWPRFAWLVRNTTGYGTGGPPIGTTAERVLFHGLQQWLQMHSFMAAQVRESRALDHVLASAVASSGVTLPNSPQPTLTALSMTDAIGWMEDAWLTFYYVVSQRGLTPAAFSMPDYRVGTPDETKGEGSQKDGIIPTLLETATEHLRLLSAYVDEKAPDFYTTDGVVNQGDRDALAALVGRALRFALAAEVFAGRAETFGSAWSVKIDPARQDLKAEMSRLRDKLTIAVAQGNPLGIQEDDLPLYFGDVAGTNSRFFASSDYLVSTWAKPAVASAQSALAAARDAWLNKRNSEIQATKDEFEQDRRVESIGVQYGEKIIAACGLTDLDAKDACGALKGTIGRWVDPDRCYIKETCVSYQSATDPISLAQRLTVDSVRFGLCVLAQTGGLRSPGAAHSIDACTGQYTAPTIALSDNMGGRVINAGGVSCQGTGLFVENGMENVPFDVRVRAEETCEQALGRRDPLPSATDVLTKIDPSCFRGTLGSAAQRLLSGIQDMDAALDDWEEAENAFKLDVEYCKKVEVNQKGAIERAEALKRFLDNTRSVRDDARMYASISKSIGDSASSYGSLTSGGGGLGGATFVSVVGKMWGWAFGKIADDCQEEMEIAQTNYNIAKDIQAANDKIAECWHNVDLTKLKIDGAYQQFLKKKTDSELAATDMRNLRAEVLQAANQGAAAMDRELQRTTTSVAHHYWMDEKIERFKREFAWAKRLTYLAMRAVEYEFQESLNLRSAIVKANHPDELEVAIRAIDEQVASRTINRRRPEEATIVLSLRDDVLGTVDKSTDPAGERRESPAVFFRNQFRDTRFGVYSRDGRWLGQGIPFTLGPSGILGDRCGERLWRVTATVQGDGLSEREPGVPLLLLKRNTFESQWCKGKGDGSLYQVGSVQPSRNLFSERGMADPESEGSGFSTALVYPWFNIRRTDFYKISYQDGSSEELAGRGLYGDYILLFPKEILQQTQIAQGQCLPSAWSGFPLERVEDVLLRFDYLSVDNLPDLLQ